MVSKYLNRELTWMRFNDRVLEEARDKRNPLIERFRFLSIFHTNLDEFFMVRVSGLKQQLGSGIDVVSFDGLSPKAQLARIGALLQEQIAQVDALYRDDILPAFKERGVHILPYDELDADMKSLADSFYRERVHPVLTPLAVGPTKTFPFISNLSLNLAVEVRSPTSGEQRLARVKIPSTLPRLVRVDGGVGQSVDPPIKYVMLEEVIAANLPQLFPGVELGKPWVFRVTRDADLEIKEDEADDLLTAIREEVRNRRFGRAVRLEIQKDMPDTMREALRAGLRLHGADVHRLADPLDLPGLRQLLALDLPQDKFVGFVPVERPTEDLFSQIQAGDMLLHHPFESFNPVVEFLQQAAEDPHVAAIKQTLYRTSGDSPIIGALLDAAQRGKQVAAVVELKARFDEENNILWAQKLEENGVHVIYGDVRHKVHAKMSLVIRNEGGRLWRYAHIGTGNYNPTTARVYTDLGLLTCNKRITADIADLFNRLTGFSEPEGYRNLMVAYRFMHQQLLAKIDREIEHAKAGRPARLVFKCNAVAEPEMIDALYRASQAGVEIDLIVRGICCLRPGVPGMSERIRVRSILGRFLEHSRVYWFNNGGEHEAYIGSADLMERNLLNRIEILTPILDPDHRDWLLEVYLRAYLDDQNRARLMQADGTYERPAHKKRGLDVQRMFIGYQR